MKTLDKLKKKKKELKEQMQRGREISQQKKAERMRKKHMAEPGTIRYGLAHKQNPLEFMKEAHERRKSKRKQKD